MSSKMMLRALMLAALAGASQSANAQLLFDPAGAGQTIVPFSANGAQGSEPANPADPLQRNDDDFAVLDLPFQFCFFGTNYNQVFINNNGNLSFGAGFSTFTASGFPINGFPMIAPFWGDVDTRNANSGVASYRMLDTNADTVGDTLVVTWSGVGYYNTQANLLNTFQVAITSNATTASAGFGTRNVAFTYGDMQWTTGSASGAVNGFGGTPATVGINSGNGVNFFQIGRFDHAGNDYDGPGGVADGVSYLDNQQIFFDICGQGVNVPPVATNLPPGNVYSVIAGNQLNTIIGLIGPELLDAITNITVLDPDGAQIAGLVLTPALGDPGSLTMLWNTDLGDLGTYNLDLGFTDSFGNTTHEILHIRVIPTPAAAALGGLGLLMVGRRRR